MALLVMLGQSSASEDLDVFEVIHRVRGPLQRCSMLDVGQVNQNGNC